MFGFLIIVEPIFVELNPAGLHVNMSLTYWSEVSPGNRIEEVSIE